MFHPNSFNQAAFSNISWRYSTALPTSIFGMRRLRAAAVQACGAESVATAAGFSLASWTDPAAPHVFPGIADGLIRGRNRGRLPFVEVAVSLGSGAQVVAEQGGDLAQTLTIRCHAGGGLLEADSQTMQILSACMRETRSSPTQLPELGPCRMGELVQGPWGHRRDATLTVYQTYYR